MHAHKYAKSFLYVEVMKQNPFLQVTLDQLVQIQLAAAKGGSWLRADFGFMSFRFEDLYVANTSFSFSEEFEL